MINKPNMYRVNYRVMEGNNYAGGWGQRHTDITNLEEVGRFSNVDSVEPIFIEIGEPIDQTVIDTAVKNKAIREEKECKLRAVREAELQLERAKSNL